VSTSIAISFLPAIAWFQNQENASLDSTPPRMAIGTQVQFSLRLKF